MLKKFKNFSFHLNIENSASNCLKSNIATAVIMNQIKHPNILETALFIHLKMSVVAKRIIFENL
jgi:hypothetical protein